MPVIAATTAVNTKIVPKYTAGTLQSIIWRTASTTPIIKIKIENVSPIDPGYVPKARPAKPPYWDKNESNTAALLGNQW